VGVSAEMEGESARAKVAVVGLGYFGRLITSVLNGASNAMVLSVCDTDRERLKSVASEFGVAGAYSDYREMLDDRKHDAIFVATPEDSHVEQVLLALGRGAHVFVEKPLALRLKDTASIEKAAREAARQVMVGHILRFDPRLVDLKQRVDGGELGQAVGLYARRSVTRQVFTAYQRCHPWLMLGIHDIDAALWLLSDVPATIYAVQRSVWGAAVADSHWALIQMRNGAVVSIESLSCVPPTVREGLEVHTRLVGTLGTATLDGAGMGYVVEGAGFRSSPLLAYSHEVGRLGVPGALGLEIHYFLRCIASGDEIKQGTIHQAQLAIAVAQAAISSEETGREVRFEWTGEVPEP
jgi:UDP-N-acetylglucosamine 3-dehydrogenase